jgi:drug/metabolite transporter (DMT)-like permease
VSGAVTSGLGYVAWYAALPGLGAVRAAIAQLAVPALAALGGVALLGEHIGLRLAASSLLILGGVLLAIARQALPAALRRRTDALV